MGDESAGNESSGNRSAGNELAGDESASNESAGDKSTDNESVAEESAIIYPLLLSEMEKCVDSADASVLIFSLCCANFLDVNGQNS